MLVFQWNNILKSITTASHYYSKAILANPVKHLFTTKLVDHCDVRFVIIDMFDFSAALLQ